MTHRTQLAVCAYSLPHMLRYQPDKAGEFCTRGFTLNLLADLAVNHGLAGIEFPLETSTPVFDGKTVETAGFAGDIAAELSTLGLRLIADYGVILDHPIEHNLAYLRLAHRCSAEKVRVILSHVLCGDRRKVTGGWDAHLAACAVRLADLLPVAQEIGLKVCVENHQDLTSAELIWLYEASGCSPAFGVTLDTGNPLAVAEDPVQYARAIAPLIGHVHLKDYTVHFAPEGYHLVRCKAGTGVIDFKGIMNELMPYGQGLLPAVEVAAQATRTVPILDMDWWTTYPSDHYGHLPVALKAVWAAASPLGSEYGSAWEHSACSETVADDEMETLTESIAYLRAITPSG